MYKLAKRIENLKKRITILEEKVNKLEAKVYREPIEILLDDFTADMFISDDIGETDLDDTY